MPQNQAIVSLFYGAARCGGREKRQLKYEAETKVFFRARQDI